MKKPKVMAVRALALFVCLLLAGTVAPLRATNLTGTFRHPDGSPVNGKLIFLLSQPARLNDGSAQVVPMVKIFTVENGQLEAGAFIYGNDVLQPPGTYYLVRLVDNNNNLLFEQKWSIQGTNLDLGTLTPTTVGVVLADPLVKNSTLEQSVEGPVSFTAPVTAFSLTLNGDMIPATSGTFNLGKESAPWREVFTEQLRTKGPRPWVDVRAFGAKGDGVTDDTQAFINAITFAANNGGAVFIPASDTFATTGYKITSTIDIGAILAAVPNSGLHIFCGSSKGSSTFKNPPTTTIVLQQPQGQPGLLIDAAGGVQNVTIENCTFKGGTNLGTTGIVYKRNSGRLMLNNVTVAVGYNASATDNHALIIEDTLWVRIFGGSFLVEGSPGTRPPIVLRGRDNTMTNLVGLVDIENVVLAGGGIRYHQETTMQGSAGTYIFKEVVSESSAMPLLELTKGATANGYKLGPLVFINCVLADNVGNARLPLVGILADNTTVNGLTAIGSNANPAVELFGSGASVSHINVMGVGDFVGGGRPATYSTSKLPAGPGTVWKREGFDIYAATAVPLHNQDSRLINEVNSGSGPTIRLFRDQEASSAFNIHVKTDSSLIGLGVGRGWRGWDTQVGRTNDPATIGLDFSFAELNAPEISSLTPATGGTLAEGTYYYRVEAKGTAVAQFSGPGPEKSVAVAAPNNAVNVAWNAVPGASSYLVHRFTFSQAEFGLQQGLGTSKCLEVTTTSVTDDGSWATCTAGPNGENKTVRLRHRLTRDSLRLNHPTATTPAALIVQNARTDQRLIFLSAIAGTSVNPLQIELVGTDAELFSVTNAGNLRARGTLAFRSGSASNFGTFQHNNTASRTYTLPDASGNVAVTLSFSSTLDFASIAAQSCAELPVTATGASPGDPVVAAWPATLESGLTGVMYVSAANTVKVRLCNITASPIDPASQTFAGRVLK